MKIEPFEMERWQGTWENQVRFNLAESGIHPVPASELIAAEEKDKLLDLELGYSQANGTTELRLRVASLYPGAAHENVTVTNGSSEANFATCWKLLESGDHVVVMRPNYMQIWGLVRSLGCRAESLWLRAAERWAVDLDELNRTVTPLTKLIAVCNPNNPTGSVLSREEMEAIVETAARNDAWILSDEVYRGAELEGPRTASFWGRYHKLIVVGGLSKAFGLPGLRVGWVVTSPGMAEEIWACRDYITISPGRLSDRLALAALRPEVRDRLLGRTRTILNDNLACLVDWADSLGDRVSWIRPRAGAISYFRYSGPPSRELAENLLRDKSVLIEPGAHFGMENYMRIGFGYDKASLEGGLAAISETLRTHASLTEART